MLQNCSVGTELTVQFAIGMLPRERAESSVLYDCYMVTELTVQCGKRMYSVLSGCSLETELTVQCAFRILHVD